MISTPRWRDRSCNRLVTPAERPRCRRRPSLPAGLGEASWETSSSSPHLPQAQLVLNRGCSRSSLTLRLSQFWLEIGSVLTRSYRGYAECAGWYVIPAARHDHLRSPAFAVARCPCRALPNSARTHSPTSELQEERADLASWPRAVSNMARMDHGLRAVALNLSEDQLHQPDRFNLKKHLLRRRGAVGGPADSSGNSHALSRPNARFDRANVASSRSTGLAR